MLKYPMLWFIRAWRKFISPLYGDVCKYYPTCSAYGERAVSVHGGLKGAALTWYRILRCNPWSMGGVDFVPGTPEAESWSRECREEEARQLAGQKVS